MRISQWARQRILAYTGIAIYEAVLYLGREVIAWDQLRNWPFTVSFAVMIFATNFTFFAYQLAPYKSVLTRLSRRQWLNLGLLAVLPFISVGMLAFSEKWAAYTAVALLPLIINCAFENWQLTQSKIYPEAFLDIEFSRTQIRDYVSEIAARLKEDKTAFEATAAQKELMMPMHNINYTPSAIDIVHDASWDRLIRIASIATTHGDSVVYRAVARKAIDHLYEACVIEMGGEGSLHSDDIRAWAIARFRSLMEAVSESASGSFAQIMIHELGLLLGEEEQWKQPVSRFSTAVSAMMTQIELGRIKLDQVAGDRTALNALHRFVSRGLYAIIQRPKGETGLDSYNISYVADQVCRLGSAAIAAGNVDYLYRCLETLGYLACNSAKLQAFETIVACVAKLVQLGREAKSRDLQCFWDHCILPPHIHAEEHLGHILTWLVRIPAGTEGKFKLQSTMEQAYSRLRGVGCKIQPRDKSYPKFWIEEEHDSEGEPVAHRESVGGMYGYGATLDYSDVAMLKEFVLYAFD